MTARAESAFGFFIRHAHWAAGLIGFTLIILCFYPGQMSADSLDHLRQARAGIYTDWHSPVMSWWWGCIDRIVPGPFGLLVFHNLLFWSGLAGLLGARFTPVWAAILTLALGLAPCCVGLLGTIWSDVGMGAAMLLAVALIDRFSRTRSWPLLSGAALLLLYACAVRKNAAAAVLPVAIWAATIATDRGRTASRFWRFGPAAVGIFVAITMFLATQLINQTLAGPQATLQSQQLFLHDLAAISLSRHENVLPAYLQSGPTPVTLDLLQKLYTSKSVEPLIFGDEPKVPLTSDYAIYIELRRRWMQEITRHPSAYLRHRTAVMAAMLGLVPDVVYPYHWGINPNEFGYQMNQGRLLHVAMSGLASIKGTLFFRGWFFGLLGVATVAVACLRNADLSLTSTMVASGFAYVAPYFLISPAGDFRLIWWMVVAVLVSIPICLAPKKPVEHHRR